MRTITTAVSFRLVPIPEMGVYANRVLAAGWRWTHNGPDWLAHFQKEFEGSAKDAEREIRAIMGGYYRSAEQIAEDALELRRQMNERAGEGAR